MGPVDCLGVLLPVSWNMRAGTCPRTIECSTTHGQVSTDVEKDKSAHLSLSVCQTA
jgi:hypothetical protein